MGEWQARKMIKIKDIFKKIYEEKRSEDKTGHGERERGTGE